MTKDEIIEMVMQIGGCDRPEDDSPALKMFETFAKLIAEKAIKEALAQEQEPVAYDKTEMNCFVQDLYDKKMQKGKHGHYETMFHVVHQAIKRTTPPQRTWVGLTDEERQDIALEVPIDAVLITEAKLKDKNTQKTTGENNLS